MLAVWFVSIVSVIVGSQVYEHYQGAKYDDIAIPYIQKVIPELSKWDLETTRGLMAPEVLDAIPPEQIVQIIAVFSRMGALQSFETPEFVKIHSQGEKDSGTQTVVVYETAAKYENGDAKIVLKLLEREKSFDVFRFNLSSSTLVE